MDRKWFDALTRGIGEATTRRSAMSALGAALLGVGFGPVAEARKKRKKRRKRNRDKEPGGGLASLCCSYDCEGDPTVRHVCIADATPGETKCEETVKGCLFIGDATVDVCEDCCVDCLDT